MRLTLLLLLVFFTSSCRDTEKRSSVAVEYVQQTPEKVAALAVGSEARKVYHDHRGYPKVSFVLRLDMFDEVADTMLPKCMQPLAPDLAIAELRCVKGGHSKVILTVSHVDQLCYRDPMAEAVKARKSVNMGKCKASELLEYSFKPDIRVDIEQR